MFSEMKKLYTLQDKFIERQKPFDITDIKASLTIIGILIFVTEDVMGWAKLRDIIFDFLGHKVREGITHIPFVAINAVVLLAVVLVCLSLAFKLYSYKGKGVRKFTTLGTSNALLNDAYIILIASGPYLFLMLALTNTWGEIMEYGRSLWTSISTNVFVLVILGVYVLFFSLNAMTSLVYIVLVFKKRYITPEITVWMVQDGVLTTYEREDYVGDNPAWLDSEYVQNRPVNHHAVGVYSALESGLNAEELASHHLQILTEIVQLDQTSEEVINRQKDAKRAWIGQTLGETASHNLVFCEDKTRAETASCLLGRPLLKTDVLIDDVNENLVQWEDAGGTAVKYCNSPHSAAFWKGAKIQSSDWVNRSIDTIIASIEDTEDE